MDLIKPNAGKIVSFLWTPIIQAGQAKELKAGFFSLGKIPYPENASGFPYFSRKRCGLY
jgi:hypothetical protein